MFGRKAKPLSHNTQLRGALAEDEAQRYLEAQGLVFQCRNYRCPMGEIDLIMKDGENLVFVEVRFRKQSRYGSASESVTPSKQKKVIRAAEHYLLKHGLSNRLACRFDVISIVGIQIDWIKNAFTL